MEKDQGSKGYRGGKTSRSRILSSPRRRPRDKWGGKKRLRDHCNSSPLSLPVPSFFPPLNVSSPPYNFSRHSQINTTIHHHYHSSSRPAPLAKSSHTLPSTRERERERDYLSTSTRIKLISFRIDVKRSVLHRQSRFWDQSDESLSREREKKNHPWRLCRISRDNIRIISKISSLLLIYRYDMYNRFENTVQHGILLFFMEQSLNN